MLGHERACARGSFGGTTSGRQGFYPQCRGLEPEGTARVLAVVALEQALGERRIAGRSGARRRIEQRELTRKIGTTRRMGRLHAFRDIHGRRWPNDRVVARVARQLDGGHVLDDTFGWRAGRQDLLRRRTSGSARGRREHPPASTQHVVAESAQACQQSRASAAESPEF